MSDTKPQFDELRREGRRVYDSRGRLIARCSEQHPPREKTPPYWVQEAYAQLFKASPKMLAALESMVAAFDGDIVPPANLPDGVTPMAVMFARDDALKASRAAIAEAKGEL